MNLRSIGEGGLGNVHSYSSLCSGIPAIDIWSIGGGGALVYVHSAICETYLV